MAICREALGNLSKVLRERKKMKGKIRAMSSEPTPLPASSARSRPERQPAPYVELEARVPDGHPLRVIRSIADDVLAGMSAGFEPAYTESAGHRSRRSG